LSKLELRERLASTSIGELATEAIIGEGSMKAFRVALFNRGVLLEVGGVYDRQ
jgi:hypothetical protein